MDRPTRWRVLHTWFAEIPPRGRGLHGGGRFTASGEVRLKRGLTLGPWLLLLLAVWPATAQTGSGTVVVRVRSGAAPVSSADVTAGGLTMSTDVQGEARLTLPAGEATVTAATLEETPGKADDFLKFYWIYEYRLLQDLRELDTRYVEEVFSRERVQEANCASANSAEGMASVQRRISVVLRTALQF